jgi:uncharacterized membrane protein YeaQ/YmgE (transglycosylase-associated protein family)
MSKERKRMHFVVFVVIGLIAGALAGRFVNAKGYGVLGDVTVGMVGAFLGGWASTTFADVAGGELLPSLFTAVVGAIALLWAIRLVAPSRL